MAKCRLIIARLAALVYKQEQREGALRIAHARLRLQAEQVAVWGGGQAETAHLNSRLVHALANQQVVVLWSWMMAAVTASLDYIGSLVTYLAIAYAVWSGGRAHHTSDPAGRSYLIRECACSQS